MDSTNEQPDARTCIACDGIISPRAFKCSHCGAFQNWRRYFQLSSSILSLLIALISVTALVLPSMLDVLFEGADLKVELVDWNLSRSRGGGGQPGEYKRGLRRFTIDGELMISNTGNRSAYLDSVRMVLQLSKAPEGATIGPGQEHLELPFNKTVNAEFEDNIEVSPEAIQFIQFTIFDQLSVSYPVTDEEWREKKYHLLDFSHSQLVVEILRHDLSREKITFPLGWFTTPEE